MTYTPTEWKNGDIITAVGLNNMEQGISDANTGSTSVIINDVEGTLDKTYAEIYDLLNSGTPCFIRWNNNDDPDLDEEYAYYELLMPIICVYKYNETYRIVAGVTYFGTLSQYFVGVPTIWTYGATVSSGYPVYTGRAILNEDALMYDSTQSV